MKKILLNTVIYGVLAVPVLVFLLLVLFPFLPYYDEPHHDPKNWVVGHDGEPPNIHSVQYSQGFKILYSDYLKALDVVFSFANKQGFGEIQFGECFQNVLKLSFSKERLPCGAVYFTKGAPTKFLVRIIITDKQVLGCRYSGPNYIDLDVVITSSWRGDMANLFVDTYVEQLKRLEDKYHKKKEGWSESNCYTMLSERAAVDSLLSVSA